MKPRPSIAAVFLSAIIATTAVPAHAANDPDSTQTLKDMTTPRSASNNGNTMQPTLKKGEPTYSTTALTDAGIGTPTPWGNVNIYHTTVVQSANVYGDGAWYAWQD